MTYPRAANLPGEQSPNWREVVGYSAMHYRLRNARGRPMACERCGTEDTERTYEWANLTGRFEDLSDYERMCVPCHRHFDQYERRGLAERDAQIAAARLAGATTKELAVEHGITRERVNQILRRVA